ncbi:hypothetical protein NP493_194g06015 [Ridgeia piscesae]|uniref:C-type lectin domain-containing protein n=1 Tax=Ridgeia piscesae TaxID=27915 RepID=A0AAD9P200_RIDPI|nr:hypothetical protein NP493_194g06015 [Ridgeia piscesae]
MWTATLVFRLSLAAWTIFCVHGQSCPSSHIVGTTCYRPQSTPASWTDAENDCQRQGGHLAAADSSSKQTTLQLLMAADGLTDVWLGGQLETALYDKGIWKWVVAYNNCNGGGSSGQTGYLLLNTSCVYVTTSKATWFTARTKCQQRGGDLLKIGSAVIQDAINTRFDLAPNTRTFWIGLSRRGWFWTSGQPFTYFNWKADSPNGDGGNCLRAAESDQYRWSNSKCSSTRAYYCLTAYTSTPNPNPVTSTPLPKHVTSTIAGKVLTTAGGSGSQNNGSGAVPNTGKSTGGTIGGLSTVDLGKIPASFRRHHVTCTRQERWMLSCCVNLDWCAF